MRFKIGDKSTGVEIVSISDGMYHLLCSCENMFSRGMSLQLIPAKCRKCADETSIGVTMSNKTLVNRPYNDKENDMINKFLSKD